MITRDDYAKILDFGLAKLVEPHGATGAASSGETATAILAQHSTPGMIMGTAGYMSPEQAQGKVREIDHRSDIFSFGCILYEAATGQKAFAGKDPLDSLHKIVHAPAPLIRDVNPIAPEDLQRIVRRCLAKEPEKRYQSIKDVAIELDELWQELKDKANLEYSQSPESIGGERVNSLAQGKADSTQPSIAGATRTDIARSASSAEYIVGGIKRHRTRSLLALVALVLIVVGGGYALYKYAGQKKSAPPIFQNAQVSRVTTSGTAGEANISPDGKYVAYVERLADGYRSLWIKQTASGNTLQIVPPTKASLDGTTFSPDGNFVYYLSSDLTSEITSAYQVTSIGGSEPKRVIADTDSPISLSPDGKQATFVREDRDYKFDLVIANLDGSGERVITTRQDTQWFSQNGPAWSPDGKTIVCSAGEAGEGDNSSRLLGVDVASGAVKEISSQRWLLADRVAWMPDESAVLVLAANVASRMQLWRVSYPDGAASQITNDVNSRGKTSLGVTADGHTIVTTSNDRVSQIWTVPFSGNLSGAKQITSGAGRDGFYGLDWTPDGRIVFSSQDGGQSDIWIMNADGSNRKRITSDDPSDLAPAVSPDGRYLVFESYRPKHNTPVIWRMDLDGGNLKQLTSIEDQAPQFSPDGQRVVYMSWAPGVQGTSMWQVSIDGGAPVQLTDYYAQFPSFSPDGNWIAFLYYDDQVTPKRWRNAIIPASGGVKPVKLFDRPNIDYQFARWTRDGRYLSYIGPPGYPGNVWLQPVAGGEPKKLTDFKSDIVYQIAWSRDGKTLALARGTETSDVVLMRDAR